MHELLQAYYVIKYLQIGSPFSVFIPLNVAVYIEFSTFPAPSVAVHENVAEDAAKGSFKYATLSTTDLQHIRKTYPESLVKLLHLEVGQIAAEGGRSGGRECGHHWSHYSYPANELRRPLRGPAKLITS